MDCGYARAGVLVVVGAGLRALVSEFVLRGVGLGTGWGEGVGLSFHGGIEGLVEGARDLVLGKWSSGG